MIRRFFCLFVCLTIFATCALADFSTVPTRDVFSMGYDRLETALRRQRPITWQLSLAPLHIDGVNNASLDVLSAILSNLEIKGTLQAFETGGYLEASAYLNGREFGSVGQISLDDRVGINLNGEWLSILQGRERDATALLNLDTFGQSILHMDYAGVRAGNIPFYTPLYNAGIKLWSLASPYARDNTSRSVPSGATSHATDYEITTLALHTILDQWIGSLSMDGLSIGIPGTDLYFGVSEEGFAAFVERARAFAGSVSLAKPLTFALAFGEADILQLARGSGTLQEGDTRTNVSYDYTCDLSDKSTKRRFTLDFQPNTWETLVLKGTMQSDTNKRTASSQSMDITASGLFDGKPYQLELKSDMANEYVLGESDRLEEWLSGTLEASFTYDGESYALSVSREGRTVSWTRLTAALLVEDEFDLMISKGDSVLFHGIISVEAMVEDGAPQMPTVLADAACLEDYNFMSLEILRDTTQDTYANVKQRFMQLLPSSIVSAISQ